LEGKTLLLLFLSPELDVMVRLPLATRGREKLPRVDVPRTCRDEALDVAADSRGEEMRLYRGIGWRRKGEERGGEVRR
jgi:hypothetical protein